MEYYYTDGKERKGPLALDALLKFIAENNRCYIWKPGLSQWVAPTGIPEVAEALEQAATPPLPPTIPSRETIQAVYQATAAVEAKRLREAAAPDTRQQNPDPFKIEPKVQASSGMDSGPGITRTATTPESPVVPSEQRSSGGHSSTGSGSSSAQRTQPKAAVGAPTAKSSGTTAQPAVPDYPKCGVGKRIGAFIIDYLIVMVIFVPAVIFMVLATADQDFALPFIMLSLGLCIPPFVYLLIRDGLGNGQSIGKRLVKTMVVDLTTNAPCTKGKSALRNLISGIIASFPYVGWIVDVVLLFAHDKGFRVGDLVAKTMVIAVEDYKGTVPLD